MLLFVRKSDIQHIMFKAHKCKYVQKTTLYIRSIFMSFYVTFHSSGKLMKYFIISNCKKIWTVYTLKTFFSYLVI